MSFTISFLQREALEAAKYDHELAKAYELAARFATSDVVRSTFAEMAAESKASSESWMRLANHLWLQRLLGEIES